MNANRPAMFNFLASWKTLSETKKKKGVLDLKENKAPHETLTEKNNGLSSAQEVLYAKDYKKADKATEQDNNKKSEK